MGLGTKKKNKKIKQMNTKERGPKKKNRGRQINEKHGYKLEGGNEKEKKLGVIDLSVKLNTCHASKHED